MPTPSPDLPFPVKEPSGPHILQKSALSVPDSSPGPFFAPEVNDQGITVNSPSTLQDYSYFDRTGIIEPNKGTPQQQIKSETMSQTQAGSAPNRNNNPAKTLKMSQSGILYTLHMIREPVVDYQESRGVPRNEEITFLTLVTSLCTQAYTAAITILVMLWNLMPLVDGLVYFVRFVLDKLIDIVQTEDNKDRAIKAAILFGELTIIIFIIFMIVGLIFMPVYVLMARLFSKIFSMIAW